MPKLSKWQAQHKGCQKAVDDLKAQYEGQQRDLRDWSESLEAWTSNLVDIIKERRIPSAEVIADGEAILAGVRVALGMPEQGSLGERQP